MFCPSDPRLRRFLQLGLIPLLTICLTGCPMDGTPGNGDQPPDNGDGTPGQPTPTEDAEIEVAIQPIGGGTVSQTSAGNRVTVTAVPSPGWLFVTWFGSTDSTSNPLTILATEDTELGARFARQQADSDGDGVANVDDVCPGHDDTLDADRDSVPDGCDECDGGDDRDDKDGDGVADACDDCPNDNPDDSDEDGSCDSDDLCPGSDDTADDDDDGTPDACDSCPHDRFDDADRDGVCGDVDQCPETLPGVVVDGVGCPRPLNDACVNAIAVSDGNTAFDTERASTSGPDTGVACDNDPTNDTWYCYTATCRGVALIDVCDASFDSILAVHAGCACGSLGDVLTCGDDDCGTDGTRSSVSFEVMEGESYALRIGGFNGASGTGTLSIDCDSSCTTDAQCNDANICTDDICSEVTGECVNVPNTAACTDGNPCTVGDVCSEGACQSGGPAECSLAGDQCNEATCSPTGEEGNCDTLMPTNENGNCDDDNVCTANEKCRSGQCTDGVGPDCSAAGDDCNTASCDGAGGPMNCDARTPIREGLACNDGDACNIEEICASGVCGGGGPPNCTGFNIPCNIAVCNPAGEEGNCDGLDPVENGTPCDDDEFCNGTDSCVDGSCSGHSGDPCAGTDDVCSEPLEQCVECRTGFDCDDGVLCTTNQCEDNVCVFPPVGSCDDANLCTIDMCDPVLDCLNTPVTCPLGQVCNPENGECEALPCETDEECDDGIDCTNDVCTIGSRICLNTPNDLLCNDGLFCTGEFPNEVCDPADPSAELGTGCVRPGIACPPGQICSEDVAACVGEPATWNSTQLLFGLQSGFAAPQVYSLDEAGSLVNADLGLTSESLMLAFNNADEIEVFNSSIPMGVETDLYRIHEPGDLINPERTILVSARISEFNLLVEVVGEDVIATWTFHYLLRTHETRPQSQTETENTRRFRGSQTGSLSGDGNTITWTDVDGIFQFCTVPPPDFPGCVGLCGPGGTCSLGVRLGEDCVDSTDCEPPLTQSNFPAGVWTRQAP